MGLLTSVDKRAFHHKLRGHKEKPEIEVQMSPQEMQTWYKAVSDLGRWVDNVDCMTLEPSLEQAQEMQALIEEILAKIGRIRVKIGL